MRRSFATLVALMLSVPLALGACSGGTSAETSTQDNVTVETTNETVAANETAIAVDAEAKTEVAAGTNTTDVLEEEVAAAEESESASAVQSKSANVDNLVNWGIKIAVPDGATGVLKGNDYYIYTSKNSFPYVLVTVFNMDKTGEDFLAEYTDYMKGNYSDLKVEQEPTATKIGDKDGTAMVYSYAIEGHPARDTRVVVPANGRVYMFATKEIDELELSVGKVFEQVIKDAEIYKAK